MRGILNGCAAALLTVAILPYAEAATIPAADCSNKAVQAAIDSAGNGDTVTIPAGTCTWTALVIVPPTKGVTLKGAGMTSTIIRSGTGGEYRLLRVRVASGNALTRVTGIKFDHALTVCLAYCGPVEIIGTGVNTFRFDHNHVAGIYKRGLIVIPTTLSVGTATGHELSGLIDHNTFECSPTEETGCDGIDFIGSPSWNNAVSLAANIAAGWGRPFTRPYQLGSNKAIYVEDNIFQFHGLPQNGAFEGYGGIQVVWRFNYHNGPSLGWHGVDSGGERGPHWTEIYRNTLDTTDSNLAHYRSGTGMMFDNTYTGSSSLLIAMTTYRARPEQFFSGQGACNGKSPLDGNVGSGTNPGWPCLDQPGWTFDEDGGAGFILNPVYFFGNLLNGSQTSVALEGAGMDLELNDTHKCNREYYNQNASFNGAATIGSCNTGGVGYGPLANRPATCTTGVGYWATDQGSWNQTGADGVLYKCTATNIWTLFYVPYPYPHPLSALSAPTNFKIVP